MPKSVPKFEAHMAAKSGLAMAHDASFILQQLRNVDTERERRRSDPELGSKVEALKRYQQRRFRHTYNDLLRSVRYAAVTRFFLDKLYGPSDFSRRDAQFARVVPAMVRLFPQEIVETVATLASLHSLSETLDSEMASHLEGNQVDARSYLHAWQCTARESDRQEQITLTLNLGSCLDHFTRKPLLRRSLHLMRGPARWAGLSEIQQFLELGFDTFQAMGGARDFIAIVEERERMLAVLLFAAGPSENPPERATSQVNALSRLP